MDKHLLKAIALLTLAVGLLFLPTLLNLQGIFHVDLAMSEFPEQFSLASSLQKGIIPLWNPYTWGGAVPFNYSSIAAAGHYYPLWAFYLLANLNNLNHSYFFISILPLMTLYWIAALGMFIFLTKSVKCDAIAAIIGACSYIYSPLFVYYYGATSSLVMLGWLPWLLYLYIETNNNFKLWKLFLSAIIFSFICIAGRPHFMIFIMIIWGTIILAEVLNALITQKKKLALNSMINALSILILGCMLGSISIIPIFQMLQASDLYTNLDANSALTNTAHSISLPYLSTLFTPDLFGNITGLNFIFEPLTFCEANLTGGMMTTLTVVFGLLMPFFMSKNSSDFHPHRKYALVFFFLYVFAILCALGPNTPFYKATIGRIPVAGGIPFPCRYRTIQCFAASILVAMGLNALFNLKSSIDKKILKRTIFIYLFFSSIILIMVVFYPRLWKWDYLWWGKQSAQIEGYLPLNEPFGFYTPRTSRITQIHLTLDDESEGEIRYAKNHKIPPSQGILAGRYFSDGGGHETIAVDIPPNQFCWIYPLKGTGSLAYWNSIETRSYRYINNQWRLQTDINAIDARNNSRSQKISFFDLERENRSFFKRPLLTSFVYVLFITIFLLTGFHIFHPRVFSTLFAGILLLEFLTFGLMAFYFNTFTFKAPLQENFRFNRPSDHFMIQRMMTQLPAIAKNPSLRLATDNPYYDTFVYLNKSHVRFALMGYGIYPLEKRFKKAMELAYGIEMEYGIYHKALLPQSIQFLNNFSVGYLLTDTYTPIFEKETVVPVQGESNQFVHINYVALPRIYTSDNIMGAEEEDQRTSLVNSDLRNATYVAPEDFIAFDKNKIIPESHSLFTELQEKNKIYNVNFDNPNKVTLNADIKIPSMLILTDVWYPGWKATVDGHQQKIYRVNYCQRGIWLEEGQHQINFEFSPSSRNIAFKIFIGTWLLMGITLIIERLKGKS